MTIGEVSKKLDIPIDTLRYYEKIGLIGPVPKTKSGIRDYDDISIRQIEFIKCMRSANLTIEEIIKYMNLFKEGDKTLKERKQILVNQRENVIKQIEELKKVKERLDHKLELYDEQLLEYRLKGGK